jgi:hypothetical protein
MIELGSGISIDPVGWNSISVKNFGTILIYKLHKGLAMLVDWRKLL